MTESRLASAAGADALIARPTRMRAIGTGAATCWLRLASAVGPLFVWYIVAGEGIRSVFLMFAAVASVGALAATRMLETGNRRLEDIAA